MTDQYEPVSVDDLKPGDEVEVLLRGHIDMDGDFAVGENYVMRRDLFNAPTIRRKIKPPEPLRAGDPAKDVFGDTVTILAIDDNEAWVKNSDGERYSHALDELIRIASKPSTDGDWIEWGGGENPAPGKVVGIKTRDGGETTGPSSVWLWRHDNEVYDIIAYRIVKDDTQ